MENDGKDLNHKKHVKFNIHEYKDYKNVLNFIKNKFKEIV